MSITLPTKKIAPLTQDPKNLIIYGKPKIGKTSLLATLDNCLILDFENGSDYVDALKMKVSSIKELSNICATIREAGKPYKFIALDTVTALEDFAKPLALKLYKDTPAGEKFSFDDVLKAPMGAGYAFLREAVEKIIGMVTQVTDNVILVCHAKDSSVANTDLSVKDLDLTGKIPRILASKSDAIGYITRDDNSNLLLCFSRNQNFAECGARPVHLSNKDIIVAERQQDGTFISKWERVYPSLTK